MQIAWIATVEHLLPFNPSLEHVRVGAEWLAAQNDEVGILAGLERSYTLTEI